MGGSFPSGSGVNSPLTMYSTSGAKKRSTAEASLRMTASRYAAISSEFDCDRTLMPPRNLAGPLFASYFCWLFCPGVALGGRSDCGPALRDLFTLEAPEYETMKLHSLAGRVRPAPDIAADHFVTFRDQLFDC